MAERLARAGATPETPEAPNQEHPEITRSRKSTQSKPLRRTALYEGRRQKLKRKGEDTTGLVGASGPSC